MRSFQKKTSRFISPAPMKTNPLSSALTALLVASTLVACTGQPVDTSLSQSSAPVSLSSPSVSSVSVSVSSLNSAPSATNSSSTMSRHSASSISLAESSSSLSSSSAISSIALVNSAPTLSVSVPSVLRLNGEGVLSMESRAVIATVDDAEDNLERVELRIDGALIGQPLTQPPYEWSEAAFTGLNAGEYSVEVTAFDAQTSTVKSTSAKLVHNNLPQITIDNLEVDQVFSVGIDLDIQISANDSDGTVSTVEVRLNNNSLGIKSQPPFTWLASDLTELMNIRETGDYTITATVTDNEGDSSTVDTRFTIKADTALTLGEVYTPNIFAPGLYGGCFINREQKAQCWGGNYLKGCNGKAEGEGNCVGRAVAPNNLGKVVALAGMHTGACAVLDTARNKGSNLRCWGPENTNKIPKWSDAVSVVGGDRHLCALRVNGEVACWASTHQSESSNHSKKWAGKFPKPPANLKAKFITSNNNLACAIKQDDTFTCWNGDYNKSPVPNLPSDLKVQAISTGGSNDLSDHVCAITLQDTIQCWSQGENAAVKWFPKDTPVKSIGSGGEMSCAVKLNGEGICWGKGNNVNKVLGTDFVHVGVRGSGGESSRAFFVKSDGTIFVHHDYGKNKKKNIPSKSQVYSF